MFQPKLEGCRQGALFDVLAEFHEFVDACGFRHALDILANNRPLVEVFGGEVGGCTDNLHTLVPCLVVGLGALEGGQEPVVDVDDAVLEFFGERFAQDLHVAGEDHGVGSRFGDDFAETVLGNALVGVARHIVERHAEGSADGAEVGVISDNAAELAGEVSVAVLQEQVVKAVVRLRDEDGDTFNFRGVEELPVQVEVPFQGFQMFTDFFDVFGFGLKNGSEEECLDVLCRMLLKVNNVCARLGEHLRGSGNKALLVGAMNLQNVTGNSHSPKL